MVWAREGCREARDSLGQFAFVVCDIADEQLIINIIEGDLPGPEILVNSTATWCYVRRETRCARNPRSCVFRFHGVFCRPLCVTLRNLLGCGAVVV